MIGTHPKGATMTKISKSEILHVAHLARLDLAGPEVERFAEQVGSILAYMDTLNKVDTQGVNPTSQAISRANVFREDRLKPHLDRDDALANAPEKDEGSFLVPKIISG
jgi:aspartyl-tRNA(Asn)/glutamyl-tRNA(Gln) amidotransferase subunit C